MSEELPTLKKSIKQIEKEELKKLLGGGILAIYLTRIKRKKLL